METIALLMIAYLLLTILAIAYFIYWSFVPNNISVIKKELKYQNEMLEEIVSKLNDNENKTDK